MNGNKNGGVNKTRINRTIKVAPTTRAIRAALAVSATMLALSGSGAALAGTCAVTALNTVSCNGVFTDSVNNSVPVINLVPDLTLILGDSAPTSVTPAVGAVGLDASWGGAVTVITFADVTINTSGADGIHQYGDNTATLNNYGDINTDGTTTAANAVDISGVNDVTLVNGGSLYAYASSGGNSITAVTAYSSDGNISIDNQAGGSISAVAYSGSATAISAYAYGDTTINNDGDVSASSFSGSATGISVFGVDGDIAITNGGTIEAYSLSGNTQGIQAFDVFGDSTVTNTGGVYVGGDGYAEGISVFSGYGTATATNSGTLEVTSYLADATGVSAYGKYANVTNSGDVTVSGYNSAAGVSVHGIYGATISNTGNITVDASGVGADAAGVDVTGSGYISIYNNGDIEVTSSGDGTVALLPYVDGSDAVGISAISVYGEEGPPTLLYGPFDVNVVNGPSGIINVVAAGNATGIYAVAAGAGSVYVNNQGSDTATGTGGGYGIVTVATGYAGTISIYNSGTVAGNGYNQEGTGISAVTTGDYGYVTIDNSGSTSAYSKYDYANGVSVVTVGDYSDISIDNSGSVSADSKYGALGVEAIATGYDGDITVTQSGSISATSKYGVATGLTTIATGDYGDTSITLSDTSSIYAYSEYDVATGIRTTNTGAYADLFLSNSGDVTAKSYDSSAIGIVAQVTGAFGDIDLINSGSVSASSDNAGAVGVIAVVTGYAGDVSFDNSGSVTATGYTGAVGVEAVASGMYGDVSAINSGSITATTYNSNAIGVEAVVAGYEGDLSIDNSGSISADSTNGTALGVLAVTGGSYGDLSIDSSGSINAYSYNGAALGIEAVAGGLYSDLYVNNSGNIYVESAYSYAFGVEAINGPTSGTLEVDNSGLINVVGYISATGIIANGNSTYDTTVNSSGTIDVTSQTDDATGIYAFSNQANVYVDNSGDIDVHGYNDVFGINATTPGDGNVTVTNSGTITVESYDSDATGINAYAYGNGDVTVDNSGSITASGYNNTYGIYAYANGDGDLVVTNSGDITVTTTANSLYDTAIGIYTYTDGEGDNTVDSSGSITVNGYDYAVGIRANTDGVNGGDMFLTNSGDINVTASTGYAWGIYGDANGYTADITVDNSGSITVYGYDYAVGILTDMDDYGATSITNSGSIDVSAYGSAFGIEARTDSYVNDSPITIDSSGSITVTSSDGDAVGISAYAGSYGAYGKYTAINVTNSGSIDAASTYGDATGIFAYSSGNFSTIYVANSGSITADSAFGDAFGIYVGTGGYDSSFTIRNDGDIAATASGGGEAWGIYAYAHDYGSVYVNNLATGNVSATVLDGGGDAWGMSAYSTGFGSITITNDGTMTGTTVAGYGDAYGITAIAYGNGDISITNSGTVGAYAGGTAGVGGPAYGIYAIGHGDGSMTIDNSGTITATSDYGYATGVYAYSAANDINLTNSGDISATSGYYDSVGVSLNAGAGYYTYIGNTGTISGDIAILTFDSTDTIYNYGTINGAIQTGYGDDYLYNGDGGTWNATGYSDFGGGDDVIVNNGTIHMTDATIELGTYSVYGNGFYNNGTLKVSGADNLIDMGGPQALVPSLNPNPFYNYGVIDFQDGAPNDILTIVGDFAGVGDIDVDVSGLHGTSDLLYIDGSVVDGSVNSKQTINVDLLDLPNSISAEIPMVYVTGNSVAGDFALGTVNFDANDSFVTLAFSLISDIDATNATPDVFSLGIAVTGLSDPGTLAASIAPSVQSLANSQVGTWRQRMGVINHFDKGAVSLWARIFQDKGGFSPEHVADNFGQGGNFDWEQKNSGAEAGVDFAVTDEFSLGLLLAKTKADTHLDSPGVGSTNIDADTYGIYGTWISDSGFYLDASYRWMSFDVDMKSVAGPMKTSGDAQTFNLEAGFAWTLEGGLKVEPQFQYTRTNVDNLDVLSTTTGMTFSAEGGDSSRGRIGVALRKSFGDADNGWMWTPYATLSAVREFDGKNTYAINGVFTGQTSVEGTSALLELGVTANSGPWAIYGGLNWADGGALNSFVGGQLGVRYTFGGAAPAPAPVAAPPAKTCADLDDDGDGVNNCDDKCPGSTAGQAVGPDGCPVPLTIDLKGVNFDFDKSTLRPDAVAILDEAITILGKYPQLKVEVAGHTDSVGTEVYNQGLSERRAQAVYDYLTGHGIGADRLVGPTGYGETRPIAPNTNEDGSDNPEGRARNRRTELNVQN